MARGMSMPTMGRDGQSRTPPKNRKAKRAGMPPRQHPGELLFESRAFQVGKANVGDVWQTHCPSPTSSSARRPQHALHQRTSR